MQLSDINGWMGHWYLPSNKDNNINGILEFSDGKIKLRTIGYFKGLRDLEANEYLSICGYLFNGKSISLLSCSKPRQQLSIPGMCLFEYSPSIVIIGNEFSSIEDISLNSITIHFIGLEEWLAHGIFSIAKDPQNNNFNMNYSMPSSCEADMGEYYIKFDYNFNIHCDKFKELSAVHKAGVKFEFKETSSWKQAMDAVCNFKTFVTLCLGTEIQIDSISAKDGDNQKFDVFYNTNINSNIKLKNWFFIYFNDIKDIDKPFIKLNNVVIFQEISRTKIPTYILDLK
ncbi:ApeA N-terminal domain 1-containing protein [Cellulosilyticum lentocellum]|uniref:ApeA N-terminal domain 1-containing protein n=1 Tax=Cellulosilyticum lentocellum TaxID=29360 RepID=UPI0001D2F5ED|nr:hypothetical protein [Cellulosilyticum lentocellum]